MKTNKKRICSILLIVMMLFSMASPAFAADTQLNITINSSATYLEVTEGKGFDFLPGFNDKDFNNRYTQTDMFDNFKNVMPGDVLEEDIVVKNGSSKTVNIYMYTLAHGEKVSVTNQDDTVTEKDNPMSDSVVVDAETNVMTESVAAANEYDVAKMNDFLSQLGLTVSYNNGTEDVMLADAIDGITKPVALGKFAPNAEVTLDVTLTVPITMGNEYANSVGEVDWVFVVSEVPADNPPGGGGDTPGNPPENPPGDNPPPEETFDDPDVPLADLPIVVPGDPVEEIEDFGPPLGDAPPTGDNTNIMLYVVLLVVAAFGLKMVRKGN